MKELKQLDQDLTIKIPKEMGLLNLVGMSLTNELHNTNEVDPQLLAADYRLSNTCFLTELTIPAGLYAILLDDGTAQTKPLYTYFMNIKHYVDEWNGAYSEVSKAKQRSYAHTFVKRYMIQAIKMCCTLIGSSIHGARLPNSLHAVITNAPGLKYYEVALPRRDAKHAKIKEGQNVILWRFPVLHTIHLMKVVYWDNYSIGLPPTAFPSINADNDGDLAFGAAISCEADPKEFMALTAELKNEYQMYNFNKCLATDDEERMNCALRSTNGMSIGLSAILGKPSDFDLFYLQQMGLKKFETYCNGPIAVQPYTPDQYAALSFEAAERVSIMKASVARVDTTRQDLHIALQDYPGAIQAIAEFADVSQTALDVAKHGAQLDWSLISSLINDGLVDGLDFRGDATSFAQILISIIKEGSGVHLSQETASTISNGLYRYKSFPRGGLRSIIQNYYPTRHFFKEAKNTSFPTIREATSLVNSLINGKTMPTLSEV